MPSWPKKEDALSERIEATSSIPDSIGDTLAHLEDKEKNYFIQEGYNDGLLGKSQTGIKSIILGNTQSLQNKLIEVADVNIQMAQAQVDMRQESVANAEERFQNQKEYQDLLDKEYKKDTAKFSFSLGVVYLFIAFVLILSDIPLALKLTQQGFDLDMDANHPVQALFERPWEVFQGNWEVFLLAIGIALCSVFVKIYYDEFISRPVDKVIDELKRWRGLEAEEDRNSALMLKRRRYRIKTGLLVFSMLSIALLGIFRFQTVIQIEKEKRTIQGVSSNMEFDFLDEGGAPAAESSLPEASMGYHVTSLLTFIFITLLFPLIGGVCASMGLNTIFNSRALKQAKVERVEAESALKELRSTLEENRVEVLRWTTQKEIVTRPDYVENFAEGLYGLYNKKYEEGFLSSKREVEEATEYDLPSGEVELPEDISQELWKNGEYTHNGSDPFFPEEADLSPVEDK